MIEINIALIAAILGIIATLWKFATTISNVVHSNQAAHAKIDFEMTLTKGELLRLEERINIMDETIKQRCYYRIHDSDERQFKREDE